MSTKKEQKNDQQKGKKMTWEQKRKIKPSAPSLSSNGAARRRNRLTTFQSSTQPLAKTGAGDHGEKKNSAPKELT
jgi:hypothetical protein